MNTAFGNHFRIAILLFLPGAVLALLGYAAAGWIGFCAGAVLYSVCAIAVVTSAEARIFRRHGAAYIAQGQAPGLYGLVGELARRAGVRTPALYMMPESAAQLLVAGGSAKRSAVVVSRGLLQVLSREELAAVMAQGISRIRLGDAFLGTIAARLAEALISFSNFLRWNRPKSPEKRDGIPADALLWMLVAPLAAALIRAAAPASGQCLADEMSVQLIGENRPLAGALRYLEAYRTVAPLESVSPVTAHLFICNPLPRDSRWARFSQTHPPFTERLARLEVLGRRAINSSGWLGIRYAKQ